MQEKVEDFSNTDPVESLMIKVNESDYISFMRKISFLKHKEKNGKKIPSSFLVRNGMLEIALEYFPNLISPSLHLENQRNEILKKLLDKNI